jgi:FMN reductase
VAQIGPVLGRVLSRKELTAEAEAAISLVESADLIVAASPVYRATYTGLFKHLFDLVGQDALVDVPVILAASGGSDRHALIIEHALRPLFSFFRAHTIPVGLYATETDFKGDEVASVDLTRRIDGAVRQAVHSLKSRAQTTAKLRATPAVQPV